MEFRRTLTGKLQIIEIAIVTGQVHAQAEGTTMDKILGSADPEGRFNYSLLEPMHTSPEELKPRISGVIYVSDGNGDYRKGHIQSISFPRFIEMGRPKEIIFERSEAYRTE
jgi:hypothetical protein